MDNKIRVLQVGMTSGVGGVESFMCNINENINHEKFKVDFLVHQEINSKYLNSIQKMESTVYKVAGLRDGILKYFKEIFNFYNTNSYDIVHLNECSASFFIYCLPLLFNKKTKLIIHSHNGDSNNKIVHNILKIFQNIRVNCRLACSDVAAKWMFKNKKSIIIHNGIDLEKFKFKLENRNMIRSELGFNEENFVVGSIARFEQQKNHRKILEIFKNVLEINVKARLVLVGSGSLEDDVKKYAHELEIYDKISFLGIRNDVEKIMAAFDVFLMPSLYEGLPFVCVEAQANGLELLISNTISNEVILTDLVNVVNLYDTNEVWAKNLNDVYIKNKNKNRTIYNNILKEKNYDIHDVAKKIEEIYENLINEGEKN